MGGLCGIRIRELRCDDNGDQIPDEYQVKVTYSAVNGSVDWKEAQYVTLYKDGHYATKEEGGAGTLADDQIAKATATNGYNQASESWNPENRKLESRSSRKIRIMQSALLKMRQWR